MPTANADLLKEGSLKKINSFFSSDKHIYRLMGNGKLLRSEGKNKEFIEKYNMHKYYVTLNAKDDKKFYLIPLP